MWARYCSLATLSQFRVDLELGLQLELKLDGIETAGRTGGQLLNRYVDSIRSSVV